MAIRPIRHSSGFDKLKQILKLFAGAALPCLAITAQAQTEPYPARPIRLVVPFSPGSSTNDILGRGIAQRLTTALGQQVVVDNRPGAGGTSGSEIVAKAPPDGYTLLVAIAGPLTVAPSVYRKIGYDPTRDFAPVARVAVIPYLMVVSNSVPATNVKELIALAKSKPGGINFASSGVGGSPHLCGELFNTMAGLEMVHVPYKGAGVATTDVLSGQIQMFCTGVTALNALVKAGRLRPVGMATLKRSALMPEIPTISEQGLKNFEVTSWTGIAAPAKTPRAIVQKLYDALVKIAQTDDMKNFVQGQGAELSVLGPEAFAADIRSDITKWAKVVKAAKITPE
jgi:tripartite-type tricarboxylate transporter receptor subunit TctC